MNNTEHGQLTIKGIIDSEPYTNVSSNNNLMWFCKLHAIDNEIYQLMAIKDNAETYQKKYHEGMYIEVSGKHQTKIYNDDMSEEIVFCTIKRWSPAWKKSSEIGNALADLCTRAMDKLLTLSENESPSIENNIKYAQLDDSFNRWLLAFQLINHQCRPLDSYNGNALTKILVFDGRENVHVEEKANKQTTEDRS